ncbi:G patch domain-containing protein 4 [Pelecanus crispus]|uniref:G patch domain-containing protein 4 n=1 Tax=Pelecanus crispus TaxID=36300 RepID=UPI003F5D24A7
MSAAGPPGRAEPFAERQLRRHGWRRGQGLGKRGDGIAEPIRVKVKCDTAGVGHDAAEPFSFHWWDHVFNQAAANIAVEAGQDGISMKTLSEQGVGISNKKPRKAGSAGVVLYGRFVKSATLTARGEEAVKLPAGSESSEEEEKLDLSSARRLTDEELMRVCGGRTAHKGARHGLTMSAKLARLEEQERAFLAMYRREERQREPMESSPPAGRQEKKKKKRKQPRDGADPEVLQSQEPSGEEEVTGEEGKVVKRKKNKNQEPSGEEEVAGEEGKASSKRRKRKQKKEVEDKEEPVETEKKKKKKRRKEKEEEEDKEELAETEKKKKKKKRRKEEEEEDKEEPAETEKKKKKRRKEKEEDEEEPAETEVPLEDADGPDQAGHSPRKKRKKRKREPE